HFFEGVEMPKRYQERDHFDERTTQQVEATAVQYVSTMEPGETLDVVKISFMRRGKEYLVDLLLKAIASRHLSVTGQQAQGATILSKNDIGVHFRFYLPTDVVERDNYEAVVQEINRYFVPTTEYTDTQKKAAQA